MSNEDWKQLGKDYYHSKEEYTVKLNSNGIKMNNNNEFATGFVNFFMFQAKNKFHVVRTITGAYEISSEIFNSIEEAREYMKEYVKNNSY